MKHFKLLSLLLGLCVCAFTFTACGDDDEDDNGGNNGTTGSISNLDIEKCAHGYYDSVSEGDTRGIGMLLFPYTLDELYGMFGNSRLTVPMVSLVLLNATDLVGEFNSYFIQYSPNYPLSLNDDDDTDAWDIGYAVWDCRGSGYPYPINGLNASAPLSITKTGDKYTISCTNATFYGTFLKDERASGYLINAPLGEHTTSFSITCTLKYEPKMFN